MSAVTVRDFTDPGSPDAFAAEPPRLRLQWRFGHQVAWQPCMVVLREHRDESRPRPWDAATIHACRAVVGTRLRWPEREAAILRWLRVLAMDGEPLDDSDTLEMAAGRAGLPVRELAAYCAEPEVERALRADMAAARGRACPSWEIRRGSAVLADLPPGLERRPDPESVEQVLAWAGMPLTAAEVAAVSERDVAAVRADLARVARLEPGAGDGLWSYPFT